MLTILKHVLFKSFVRSINLIKSRSEAEDPIVSQRYLQVYFVGSMEEQSGRSKMPKTKDG